MWFRQERGSSAPRQCKASFGQHNHDTLAEIQVDVLGHPPYSVDLSPCDYTIFGPLKKALMGKDSLGRQAVRAKLVHNAAPGILRDSHSPPCVAVGQVPQQPGAILLT